MTDVRQRVFDHVDAHPGVHYKGLVRELDIAAGQAQYHLRRLRDARRLDAEKIRGRTHYFTDGYDDWERRTIALLRRETARHVIVYALESDGVSAMELAEELDLARSTVSWHLSALVEADVGEKYYDSKGRAHLRLTRPAETRDLLEAVTPSLSDRLVDRFTRLVDASFHG
jgi:predicted transcriptional regulator